MSADNLAWLQQWYLSHCNGDWEHQNGVSIETLDNPGWHLTVNLTGTALQWRKFKDVRIERTELDWIDCRILGQPDAPAFHGHGGALNLTEIVEILRCWVQEEPT